MIHISWPAMVCKRLWMQGLMRLAFLALQLGRYKGTGVTMACQSVSHGPHLQQQLNDLEGTSIFQEELQPLVEAQQQLEVTSNGLQRIWICLLQAVQHHSLLLWISCALYEASQRLHFPCMAPCKAFERAADTWGNNS